MTSARPLDATAGRAVERLRVSWLAFEVTLKRPRVVAAPPGDASADPDAPLPLGDELAPVPSEVAGARRRRFLWTVGLLALALRLLLLPLGHWHDTTVDYNVFIDLAHNHSPYDTFTTLSHIAVASGWGDAYEYYAYPPVPLYLYWPLAHLFALLHPHAAYQVAVSKTAGTANIPLDFYFWFKAPIWLADLLIATLLLRTSGTVRGFRDYLLNPYVLLISGAWTFDAIMALGLVASVYFIQRRRFAWAGVALAFGTMVKFIPVIAAPTITLYLIKKQRPLREIVAFLVAYLVACVAFVGPFFNGLLTVTLFHGGRAGGGMNWQFFVAQVLFSFKHMDIGTVLLSFAPLGTPTLFIAMLLGYWLAYTRDLSLNRMIVVTLLAFFVGSKLINEQYALVALPFIWLESRREGGIWRWFYRLFWVVPLTFAIMHVPVDRFLLPAYHTVYGAAANIANVSGLTGFDSNAIPWRNGFIASWSVALLALTFFTLSLVALAWPARPHSYAPPGVDGVDGVDGTDGAATRRSPAMTAARASALPAGAVVAGWEAQTSGEVARPTHDHEV